MIASKNFRHSIAIWRYAMPFYATGKYIFFFMGYASIKIKKTDR